MDKNIGKRLDGRYEITELIGMGGMADVYKAEDIVDKKVVAVKILKKEYADNDDFVRRFRNESKAIAVLSHPNIVKIYDVGFTDKMQFIVMEYIDGITLKEFMEQQGVLKWKDAVYFITQILRALQHAHDRGIVHRDIKPQNIMLFPDGNIKVMDFGIARFAREEGKTMSDKAIGSVHYISPEQARGDVTDERSDIYSTGVMLYEMITGRKPFDADSPVAVAVMHMQNSAVLPRQINDTIPIGLEEIVMRAMQKDPSKRYQSASEMINDIEEFKKDPSVVFGYNFGQNAMGSAVREDNEKTMYFDKNEVKSSSAGGQGTRFSSAAAPAPARKTGTAVKTVPDYEEDDDDDEDDDENEVSKTSYFVVTLTAIAATVLIVAVIFIAINLGSIFGTEIDNTDMMPNLVGVNYNDAKSTYAPYFDMIVESQEYSAEYDEGVIIAQTPKAGSEFIIQNTTVKVKVSKGPQMVTIRNVYDLEANTAKDMLEKQGFFVTIAFQTDDSVDENHVIATEPAHNEKVEKGSTIIMYVSQGPEVQDVLMVDAVEMGLFAEDAENLFKSKGLVVTLKEEDSFEEKGLVLAQSIPATDEYGNVNVVSPGTEIVLTVSSGTPPATDANITFAVPSDVKGAAAFKAYINGNISGTVTVDNLAYVSTVTITVNGSTTQTVSIEATNSETGESDKISEYVVDFTNGTVTEMSMNKELFIELFAEEEETTTEETEDDHGGILDEFPIFGNDDDEQTETTVTEAPSDETYYEVPDDQWWQTIT
ncbi:MAG: Stk1 family PASTA domain-containing Ser/Thr kinase [Oscillospiraceae bacterium]|nr:Stk1 family PASTA domain-containing Ser/Thr kinase [Oscillospiraceae bacterium]MDD7429551.1 Stk1 family PASTA domain-containing Ser/Thr kinase [Oscillospiraceae bacterium]